MGTSTENKIQILAELWMDYRDEAEFEDLVAYADLGLPLAYCVANGIVESSAALEPIFEETFDLFLEALGFEDEGFESMEEIMGSDEDYLTREEQASPSKTVSSGIDLGKLFRK